MLAEEKLRGCFQQTKALFAAGCYSNYAHCWISSRNLGKLASRPAIIVLKEADKSCGESATEVVKECPCVKLDRKPASTIADTSVLSFASPGSLSHRDEVLLQNVCR